MSSPLAIATATAALRNLLERGINLDPALNFTPVTAQPPDRARANGATGNQLNLFLYQTTPSTAWRNSDMTQHARPGEQSHSPLALNLHYLITAYGREDDDLLSHRVLARAMRTLHDHPVLSTDELRAALPDSDLYLQVERIRITDQALSLEELSKLWATFQTQYRISTGYQASIVLIDSGRPSRAPLPVLTRGPSDRGPSAQQDLTPPFPTLTEALPPGGQPAVRLGETLTVQGFRLDGDSVRLRFAHRTLPPQREELVTGPRSSTELSFTIPSAPPGWPAGMYTLAAIVSAAGDQERTTNDSSFALAPRIMIAPTTASPGDLTLTVTCEPEVQPDQEVALLFGNDQIDAAPRAAPTGTLEFTVRDVAAGEYWVRLRVDGVDSLLINRAVTPPVYFEDQRVTIT